MSVADFKRLNVKKAKYGNSAIVCDGQRFDSKLERDRYLELKNLAQVGAVRWFTRQVPFYLPGGIIYRADFLVVWLGSAPPVTVEDCKGFMTRVSINKIKQVEAIYGLKIAIITKGGKRCEHRAKSARTKPTRTSRTTV